ncbi:MAG: hypothetical protein QM778_09100 [Myxococcales bacterium]
MRSLLISCAWLLGLSLVRPSSACAEDVPTGVQVVIAECPAIVQRKKLVEHLRIELFATGVQELALMDPELGATSSQNSPDRLATVQIYYPECDEESGLVNLRISDRLTAKYVERALFVGDVDLQARPRTIALAVGELLRASWMELVLSTDEAEEGSPSHTLRNRMITRLQAAEERRAPEAAIDPSELVEREVEGRPWFRPRIEWIAGGRMFPEGASGALSSAVSLSHPLNGHLRFHLGAIAAGGGTNADRTIHLFEAAGRTGIGVTGGKEIEIELASIFELGWAQLSGTKVKDTSSFMMIGALQGTVRTRITRGLDVLVGLEGGYVLTPLVLTFHDEDLGTHVRGGLSGPLIGILIGLSGTL